MAQFGDFTVDRNSTKYVLGSGGTIISYATDEPAFEFNADGSYKGLLVEPAATNLITYSEDYSQWTNTNTTDNLSSTETALNGQFATEVFETTDTQEHDIRKTSVTLTAAVYTHSYFVKYNGRHIQVRPVGEGTGFAFANFDLINGVVGNSGGTNLESANIEAYPNGWYRCSISVLHTASGTGTMLLTCKSPLTDNEGFASFDLDYEGDITKGVYLYGAQVETGPIATSYIPTTTASVTRVKDDITQTGAQSLIGQTEGTLYIEVDWRATSGVQQNLLTVSDGTNANRMFIYNTDSGTLAMFVEADDTILIAQGQSSAAYSGIQKIAFAYKTDDFEMYRNGSSISSNTSGSLAALATLTDIDLGQDYVVGNQANMHIRAVALYTRRLTDAEAQALTTL